MTLRPLRSVLYVPAANARAMEKAAALPVDAVIFDLEDAVAPDAKAAAREALGRALTERDYGGRVRIVRINGAGTPWHEDDLAAALRLGPDAVLLPKADAATSVARIATRLRGTGAAVWAMIETPAGVLAAPQIAGAPGMGALVLGTNDLAKDLCARHVPGRQPLLMGLSAAVLAARAAGIACIDGVYNAIRDEVGLRAECEQGRDLGMDGKTLIHPGQIAIANDVFAPSDAEVDRAQREIAAFEDALAQGRGVAVLDGQLVEGLHVQTAREVLARAEAIRRLEAA